MHNIKFIRKEPDLFLKKLSHRNLNINLKSLLDLDKKNRNLIQNKEKLEQKKKLYLRNKTKVSFQNQKKYQKKLRRSKSHKN